MNEQRNIPTINEPYIGLQPYTEEHEALFFGRNDEQAILIDKILSEKCTLLFAATGVGKSSLLQAKVIPALKHPDKDNLDVVYYKDWVSDPLSGLKKTIETTLKARKTIDSRTLDDTDAPEFVEAPNVQIVCKQLWEKERGNPGKTIRMDTYRNNGRARGFVSSYFGNVIKSFTPAEKSISSRAFNHLVTPQGTKMAFPVKDLSGLLRVKEKELEQVLEKLEGARGITLLSHELAAVRDGAWMGLSKLGNADLMQRLDKSRTKSRNPLFRQSAYRAIDGMLTKMEVHGGKSEIAALETIKPSITDTTAVLTRVEWTIGWLRKNTEEEVRQQCLFRQESRHDAL